MKKVGVLTGGGDCPGLNSAIRAIVRKAALSEHEVVGIRFGWRGMLEQLTQPLPLDCVDEFCAIGGTILGSSRTNPYKEPDGPQRVKACFSALGLEGLIAIGGEDTLGVASKLFDEGVNVVGAPKTIDNDLEVTDYTIGFMTSVEIVCDSLDRVRTTAKSHDRVIVVEIMGRHAGWLATYGGFAGAADVIVIPEFPMSVSDICDTLTRGRARGKNYAIIAIAEGASILDDQGKTISIHSKEAVDSFGHVQLGGIGKTLSDLIKTRTGYDTKATTLGHLQRGGTTSALDRILSTLFGLAAMDLVIHKDFGKMPAFVNGQMKTVPLAAAVKKLKLVPEEVYNLAKVFFG